ncbi:efflux RND transporter periplasmic adaptor subunit [Gemmatimonadota bacterium]
MKRIVTALPSPPTGLEGKVLLGGGRASRLLRGALLGVSSLAMVACGRGEASEAPTLQTAEVVRQVMRITAEATGQVEPIRQVEVKSKASGEVLRLHQDVGDEVEPGALLAQIDPRDVRNSYDQAEADLQVARARLEISRAQLGRSQELMEAGVITEQEHESTTLDYANSQANMVKAQTNMELAELRLQDVTIRAPGSGTILTRSVEEGTVIQSASSNVSGGTTLFIMADLSEMQVRTLVDETDIGQITAGLQASVQVEAFPGRTFQGYVEKIEPQAVVQQNVTMFPVIVRLDNRLGLLKPGMNAEVEMLLAERTSALVVPNNAVVLPQEMAPAAAVLGMDPDGLNFDPTIFSQLARDAGLGSVEGLRGMGGRQRPVGAQGGAPEGARPGAERAAPEGGGQEPSQEGSGGVPNRRAMMDSLRAQVERGEISEDSLQVIREGFRAMMSGGDPGGQTPPGGQMPGVMVGEENLATAGLVNTTGAPRAAIAFVLLPDSTLEMRAILMGVNDWDNTEVLAGLQEGEQVALIGAAQLMAEQQEMMNRVRGMGGMFGGPGMGRR